MTRFLDWLAVADLRPAMWVTLAGTTVRIVVG